MTRFARIHHRNKSSFAKIPEEPTSWAEFKQQLNNKIENKQNLPDEQSRTSREEKSKIVVNNHIESSWCDFEESGANKNNNSFGANRRNNKSIKNKSNLNVKNGNLVKRTNSYKVDDTENNTTVKRKSKLKYNTSLPSNKLNEAEDHIRNDEIEEGGQAKKKNKKNVHQLDDSILEVQDNNRTIEIEESGHPKKKKKKHSHNNIDDGMLEVQDINRTDVIEESSYAKKKHVHNIDDSILEDQDNNRSVEIEESGHPKKRKKKHRHNIDDSMLEVQDSNGADETEEISPAKKKKKTHSHNIEDSMLDVQDSNRTDETEERSHAKKRKKKHDHNTDDSSVDRVQNNSRNDEVVESWAAKKKQKKLKFSIAENEKVENVGGNGGEGNSMVNKIVRKNKQNRSEISTNEESNFMGKNKRNKKQDNFEQTCVIDGEKVPLTKFDGFYISKPDAEKIEKIKKKLMSEGRPKQDIDGVVRRHRRNAEKFLARKRKKLCFNCREGIHNLAECPKLNNGGKQTSTGVCYKCGSTEHNLFQCRQPGNELKFAKCFICNENGHLSKQCPDNPRGLYPHGGSCRICGDVTHLKRDCPEMTKRKRDNTITVGTIGENMVDCLDEDNQPRSRSEPSIAKKPSNKIIKFN